MKFSWEVSLIFSSRPLDEKDILAEFILKMGSPAVEEMKRGMALRAFFPGIKSKRLLRHRLQNEIARIQEYFPHLSTCKILIKKFKDESWKDRWKKFAKPIQIDKALIILPSHVKTPPRHFPKKGIILRIDPEMAFGTGSHPTTYLCLQELIHLKQSTPTINSCLDLGTGSGILALAAHFLGIKNQLAIDHDSEAIQVAKENARKHGVKNIAFKTATLQNLKGRKFDLILANLILKTILEELSAMKKHLKPQGTLVLSGLLASQEKETIRALQQQKFSQIRSKKRRGWLLITCSL